MNTKILLILLLLLKSNSNNKNNNNNNTSNKLNFSNHNSKTIIKRENIKNHYKAEDGKTLLTSNFTYPFIISNNKSFETLVNTYFENKIKEIKEYEEDSYLSAKNFYESFPDTALLPYTMEVNFSTECNGQKLLSFKLLSNSYLGGAHSNPMTKGVTFDIVSNKVLSFETMYINNINVVNATLNRLIEQYVEDNNLSEILYPFEKGQLPLPYKDNFYLTKKGVTYIYNPYEIAPFAAGIINIPIPYEKLLDILSDHFKSLIL